MSKKHNSTYTIVFIIVVSLIFSLLLSIVASSLRPKIEKNEEAAVLGKILASFGTDAFAANLTELKKESLTNLSNTEIDELFKKRIEVRLVSINGSLTKTIDPSVTPAPGEDTFNVTKYVPWNDLAKVAATALNPTVTDADQVEMLRKIELPLYCLKGDDGTIISYTVPVWGKGLWGPIYGYIALEKDAATIKGATFSAPKETPGLGLEIENPPFRNNWPGKTIFDGNQLTPIEVTKAGAAAAAQDDKVDGVSGATLTCRGVTAMMSSSLSYYENYLKSLKKEGK